MKLSYFETKEQLIKSAERENPRSTGSLILCGGIASAAALFLLGRSKSESNSLQTEPGLKITFSEQELKELARHDFFYGPAELNVPATYIPLAGGQYIAWDSPYFSGRNYVCEFSSANKNLPVLDADCFIRWNGLSLPEATAREMLNKISGKASAVALTSIGITGVAVGVGLLAPLSALSIGGLVGLPVLIGAFVAFSIFEAKRKAEAIEQVTKANLLLKLENELLYNTICTSSVSLLRSFLCVYDDEKAIQLADIIEAKAQLIQQQIQAIEAPEQNGVPLFLTQHHFVGADFMFNELLAAVANFNLQLQEEVDVSLMAEREKVNKFVSSTFAQDTVERVLSEHLIHVPWSNEASLAQLQVLTDRYGLLNIKNVLGVAVLGEKDGFAVRLPNLKASTSSYGLKPIGPDKDYQVIIKRETGLIYDSYPSRLVLPSTFNVNEKSEIITSGKNILFELQLRGEVGLSILSQKAMRIESSDDTGVITGMSPISQLQFNANAIGDKFESSTGHLVEVPVTVFSNKPLEVVEIPFNPSLPLIGIDANKLESYERVYDSTSWAGQTLRILNANGHRVIELGALFDKFLQLGWDFGCVPYRVQSNVIFEAATGAASGKGQYLTKCEGFQYALKKYRGNLLEGEPSSFFDIQRTLAKLITPPAVTGNGGDIHTYVGCQLESRSASFNMSLSATECDQLSMLVDSALAFCATRKDDTMQLHDFLTKVKVQLSAAASVPVATEFYGPPSVTNVELFGYRQRLYTGEEIFKGWNCEHEKWFNRRDQVFRFLQSKYMEIDQRMVAGATQIVKLPLSYCDLDPTSFISTSANQAGGYNRHKCLLGSALILCRNTAGIFCEGINGNEGTADEQNNSKINVWKTLGSPVSALRFVTGLDNLVPPSAIKENTMNSFFYANPKEIYLGLPFLSFQKKSVLTVAPGGFKRNVLPLKISRSCWSDARLRSLSGQTIIRQCISVTTLFPGSKAQWKGSGGNILRNDDSNPGQVRYDLETGVSVMQYL